MTYHTRQRSLIDAVIDAGRDTQLHSTKDDLLTTDKSCPPKGSENVKSRAMMVLYRILAATGSPSKPCVQFVACGGTVSASAVARAAAQAAATIIGRTLLLNARMDHERQDDEPHQDAPIPDAFVSGLYHHHLAHSTSDLDLLFGSGRRSALTKMISPFQFTAIDSNAPCASPAGTALAPMCTGTVLVVRAGQSNHAAIKDAVLHISRAGGRIIGLVLDGATAELPIWIRRL